ncbi:uncharacterized protein G2W53_026402 [Senna tora]|uniref:Uncharacterized protein n=1 Tax=Senna tora TaxID=362788 RepID=A0A834TF16_9FABA|nr:uncharacterized protein G2W53_026402 [Senna tora]
MDDTNNVVPLVFAKPRNINAVKPWYPLAMKKTPLPMAEPPKPPGHLKLSQKLAMVGANKGNAPLLGASQFATCTALVCHTIWNNFPLLYRVVALVPRQYVAPTLSSMSLAPQHNPWCNNPLLLNKRIDTIITLINHGLPAYNHTHNSGSHTCTPIVN